VTGLRPEKAATYEDLHAHPWPGVLKKISESHIRNYSIHKIEIEGKLYLFSYFEYTGNDFEADMAAMGEDAETLRWWEQTDPCQLPLPAAQAEGGIWTSAEEVFYHPG
jgi:L-rhamnose mutarotase